MSPSPPPQRLGLRAHLALENSQGRGALPEGWVQLGCHSWNPPHSSMQGCPPGCSWQQVCSSNAGVGGGGVGRNENQAHGTTWPECWLRENTEPSGLKKPCPGARKVGSGIAELQGHWAGLSGEVANIWHTG